MNMHTYLLERGWKRRRSAPKEPWFYLDPTGCEETGLRVDDAYKLQKKRERHLELRPALTKRDIRACLKQSAKGAQELHAWESRT